MIGDELRARTRQFALDGIDLCSALGHTDLAIIIRRQLLRAAMGVASSNRAAARSRSRREFIAKLSLVIEESDECELWLDILETKRIGPAAQVTRLRGEASQLCAIFVASRLTVLRKGPKRPQDPA